MQAELKGDTEFALESRPLKKIAPICYLISGQTVILKNSQRMLHAFSFSDQNRDRNQNPN